MNNKRICIIQARLGSTRLPRKVLLEISGSTVLEYEINRIKLAKNVDKIVVATTNLPADDAIEKLCNKNNIDCFRGSVEDVLGRYYQCSLKYPEFNAIIRISGDCPLIDPMVIDQVVDFFTSGDFDYAGNVLTDTFPYGLAVEIFKQRSLEEAANFANLPSEREHVTQYIRKNNRYKKGNLEAEADYSRFRLALDYYEDFEVMKYLIEHSKIDDNYLHYISLLNNNPEIALKNKHIPKHEGLEKSLNNDFIK